MAVINRNGLSNFSLSGTLGADDIRIDNSNNGTVDARAGDDRITGFNNFRVTFVGGDGNDTIRVNNTTSSTLVGAEGNDTLLGVGGFGVVLDGRNGDDFLAARKPAGTSNVKNKFVGGPGADTFELPLYDNGSSTAVITDFTVGVDRLSVPAQILAGRNLDDFVFTRLQETSNVFIDFVNPAGVSEGYIGAGIRYNQNPDFVAVLANVPAFSANYVSISSPIA